MYVRVRSPYSARAMIITLNLHCENRVCGEVSAWGKGETSDKNITMSKFSLRLRVEDGGGSTDGG